MVSSLDIKSSVASLLLIIILDVVTSQQTAYNGPESIEYFQTDLNSDFSNLMELTCLDQSSLLNLLDMDITNGLNNYFGETNGTNPVQYYKLNITSKMKQLYKSSFSISTCCDLNHCQAIYELLMSFNETLNLDLSDCNAMLLDMRYQAFQLAVGQEMFTNLTTINYQIYELFCGKGSSLDTFIYVLHEKKGQLNLIETNDDSSSCTNSEKSYIDLTSYPEGEYIIAIGGYGKEYGSYYLRLSCIHYSFPITEEQFDPPSNVSIISCDTVFQNQTLNQTHPVKYYSITIDPKTTYLPFTIITTENFNFRPTNYSNVLIYIFKLMYYDEDDYEYELIDFADSTFTIDDESTLHGSYYIAVQGIYNQPANYSISMECAPPPTNDPTIEPTRYPSLSPSMAPTAPPEQVDSMTVTWSIFGSAAVLLILFGIYYTYKWKQYYTNKRRSSTFNPITDLSDNDENDERKDEQKSDLEQGMKIGGVSIRRLDLDKSVNDQLGDDTDIVQAVLSHAIQCCEDHNGLDIYQVTAVRYYERDSRKIRGVKPFQQIAEAGINVECIRLSPLSECALKALIIAVTQLWGITTVVYKLIVIYSETFKNSQCDMDKQRWEDVWSLKVLSFLLSLVVTFFIGIMISGIRQNGLYLLLDMLLLKHMKRIDNIALWIVQMGQTVNYYVCLWAVIGSYFIILEANEGEKNDEGRIDYSHAGLELILNGIALFFMLELDDMMVWEQDYVDCGEHLKIVLANYKPDTTMNSMYTEDFTGSMENDNDEEEENGMNTGCVGYMIPVLYALNGAVSILVRIVCYVGGFAAPFIIVFCW